MRSSNSGKSKIRSGKKTTARRSASRPKTARRSATKAGPDEGVPSVLAQIGPDFLERGASSVGDREVARMLHHAGAIRAQLREGVVLQRVKTRAELMLSLVADFHAGKYRRIPYRSVALMVFALSYLAAPVDIVPDVLPVIGEVDDAIVVALGARMVRNELLTYGLWKAAKPKKRVARGARAAR